MTGPTATRRAAVAAMVVALVLALAGAAVAVTGGVDRPASAVTASVDPAASGLDGHAAGTRVAARDQPEAAVVAASDDIAPGQGRAATTQAAKEVVGSRVAPDTAPGRQLVVGGGRAADMPATPGISLNTNPAAMPYVVGDIANAPFRSGSFSSVYFERVPFSSFTGRNIGALDESARLLRPGGELIIQTGPAAPAADIIGRLERLGFTNIWKTEPSYLEIRATWGGL